MPVRSRDASSPGPDVVGTRRCGTGRAIRYRCTACGNLTRFDVVASRRTRAYHHYTVAGELHVEEEEVLESVVEDVSCRWCRARGEAIEEVPVADEDGGEDSAP